MQNRYGDDQYPVPTTTIIVSATAPSTARRSRSFPGRDVLYALVLALMMIPSVLTLVPQFVLVSDLHLLETRWALILPLVCRTGIRREYASSDRLSREF